MASDKSRKTSLPHSNRPKLPIGSSLKRSTSDDLSLRRNFKRPAIESSQIGEEIEDQDAVFKPWRNLSNPPNNVDEESEDECGLKEDGSITIGKKNLTWSEEMDSVLVDSLLDQMEKGQKIGSTFTSTAFTSVAQLVGSKFGKLGFSVSNVKNRLKTLKKRHTDAQKVLCQSGFGYNDSTQMIEAPPDVWGTYLVANPDAKSFRYKRVPNFYKLDLLFGKDRATGSNAAGPKERQRQLVREIASSSEDAPLIPTNEESSCALPLKNQVETKKTKNKAIEFVCEELRSLRSGMDAVAMALEKGNLRNYTKEQLYDDITKVEGLNEISQMRIYQALSTDPNSARAFIACPIARRQLWLKVKFVNEFFE